VNDAPVLAGEAILCVAPDPWAGLWRNRHQIMIRLARANTVIYVEPRLYLGEALRAFRDGRLSLADLRRPLLAAPELPSGTAPSRSGQLWLYHDPYYAPYAGRRTGGPLTAALRRRALRRTLAGLGIRAPILWLLRPYHADLLGLCGEKLVVYHVSDEYSGFPTVTDKPALARQEEALLRRADLVIVTSPGLLASKGRHNPHTYLVPNAVDYDGFQAALADPESSSQLVARVPRPRIGYVGALNEKIDFNLLAGVAQARPDWQIILVGSLNLTAQPHKADAPRRLPNVHWPGQVLVTQVPGAIASLDVCLLPYEQNAWTANIDSLKLYEYLACGRPVVSTDVPAARSFAPLVRIAATPATFIAAIDAALTDNAAEIVAARRAAAAANTWDMRVSQIEELLTESLARKRSPKYIISDR
jgi:glycosyltransferase involved in cell wall biosynthesis